MKLCSVCGKIMASSSKRATICQACRAEMEAPAEVPVETPPPPIVVNELEEREQPPCDQCKKRPRIEGYNLCVGCQLELVYSLAHAGEELLSTPPPPPPSTSSPMSLLNTLDEKRDLFAPSDVIVIGAVKTR